MVKMHEKRCHNCVKITMKLLLTIETFGAIIKHIKAQQVLKIHKDGVFYEGKERWF